MTISEAHLRNLEEWDRVTEGRPCSMAGCNMTASEIMALVAEVRRLRDEVQLAYQEGWLRGYNLGTPSVKLGVPPAMYDDFEQSDARKALEGA